MKHIAEKCEIKECEEEAHYWLPFILGGEVVGHDREDAETFYLCSDHHDRLVGCDEDGSTRDEYLTLDTRSRTIRSVQTALYSCSEECEVCNQ